jgi:hypothetical protein
MIGTREVVYGLYGAYRLCRFDPQGVGFLNDTIEGFWRSFFSAVLVAPIHFVIVIVDLQAIDVQAGLPRVVIIEALSYLILVFAFPLAMYYLCRMLDRQREYITYIVAYNWAGVLLAVLMLPFILLDASDLLPGPLINGAEIVVTALSFVLLWYIARTTLRVSGAAAAGFVTIDFVISIIVRAITEGRLTVA